MAKFIPRSLADAEDAAFSVASRVKEQNRICMSSSSINDDMYDYAASILVKTFHPQSNHSTYLQQMREKGHAGMVVVNLFNGEGIDTRSFGCCRVDHRQRNNKLVMIDDDVEEEEEYKRPSLFPTGGLAKRKAAKLGEMWDGMA